MGRFPTDEAAIVLLTFNACLPTMMNPSPQFHLVPTPTTNMTLCLYDYALTDINQIGISVITLPFCWTRTNTHCTNSRSAFKLSRDINTHAMAVVHVGQHFHKHLLTLLQPFQFPRGCPAFSLFILDSVSSWLAVRQTPFNYS